MHDALEEVCDRLLRSDTLPDTGGTPATVIVTIDLDDLLTKTGYGTSSDGTLIPTNQVLRLANQADIVPTVLNRTGAVLDLGRSRRIATPNQTLALYARDAGCSFPTCDRSPEWSERHHLIPWIDSGETNLNNLTLLCVYITTTTSKPAAGPDESTPTASPNGDHPDPSTPTRNPSSTPASPQ